MPGSLVEIFENKGHFVSTTLRASSLVSFMDTTEPPNTTGAALRALLRREWREAAIGRHPCCSTERHRVQRTQRLITTGSLVGKLSRPQSGHGH